MDNRTVKKEYDMAMKSRAYTGLALRVLVAGYIAYLAWKIMSGMFGGTSPIPVWGVWLICAGFLAVAAAFCVYAYLAFRKALRAAELPPPNGTDTLADRDTFDSEEK